MTVALACVGTHPSTYLTRPSGEGLDQESSGRMVSTLRSVIAYYQNAEIISRGSLLAEARETLLEILEECSQENWDGYGAQAIIPAAVGEAFTILEKLPSSIEMPAIVPEPHGGIGFEWRSGRSRALVMSVIGQRTISFAGIFESGRFHGSDYFEECLPSPILNLYQRLRS